MDDFYVLTEVVSEETAGTLAYFIWRPTPPAERAARKLRLKYGEE